MSRVFFDAHFQDALSGEFSPRTDPERRHTLARLSMATVIRGESSITEEESGILKVYEYKPTWAQGFLASVACREIEGSNGFYVVSGLNVFVPESHETTFDMLSVVDTGDGEMASLSLYDNHRTEHRISLGTELNTAKLAVTNAAQRFFS